MLYEALVDSLEKTSIMVSRFWSELMESEINVFSLHRVGLGVTH